MTSCFGLRPATQTETMMNALLTSVQLKAGGSSSGSSNKNLICSIERAHVADDLLTEGTLLAKKKKKMGVGLTGTRPESYVQLRMMLGTISHVSKHQTEE